MVLIIVGALKDGVVDLLMLSVKTATYLLKGSIVNIIRNHVDCIIDSVTDTNKSFKHQHIY